MTTDSPSLSRAFPSGGFAVVWKVWRETRGRFFCALTLLASLVVYAVLTSPGFLTRYNTRFPDKPLLYSVYVWTGLFHYALQGLWILAALVMTLGGFAREKPTGTALFTLALPVGRLNLFLIRTAIAWAESIALGLVSASLISVLSLVAGEYYSFLQALRFGAWMSGAGEFTAPVVGLCALTAVFLGYRAHTLRGWNVFDVMSGSASIDPRTQLLTGSFDWVGLAICLSISIVLLVIAGGVVQARDF